MRECIVLAGGLGTRLNHIVTDVPKSLAPVAGQAFLKYVMDYLIEQGVTRIILSIGYKHEQIIAYVQQNYSTLDLQFCIEQEPLGTGGAIISSMQFVQTRRFFVLNSDTYYNVDLNHMEKDHLTHHSSFSIALKPMIKPTRYGTVKLNDDDRIIEFLEKKELDYGLINGGLYLIEKDYLLNKKLPIKFSLEKELLEQFIGKDQFYGFKSDAFFIDIGVPKDYEHSQFLFNEKDNLLSKRALFLDRDGIINELLPNDYVKSWSEFKFRKDFLANISAISKRFDFLFVVTNQQCIDKGIISVQDLDSIHARMILEIEKYGARIEGIYYCPHLAEVNCECRKPNPGMIDQIKLKYPSIDLFKSVFIGDSISDMILAKKRNIISVWLNTTENENNISDYQIHSLNEFNEIINI